MSLKIVLLFFVCINFAQIASTYRNHLPYINHTLIGIKFNDDLSEDLLDSLEENGNELLSKGRDEDILRVNPRNLNAVLRKIQSAKLSYEILTTDLGKLIKEDMVESTRLSYNSNHFNLLAYNQYSKIVEFAQYLAKQYTNQATYTSIGESYENRDIPALIIRKSNSGESNKPIILLECGIHAREWISHASCIWFANEILINKDQSILNDFDLHILPVVNPDGYHKSWTEDRLWRKNVRPSKNTSPLNCVGTDLMRNFDSHHGGPGTSKHPCAQIFCGDGPFSEPETQRIRDYVNKFQKRIKMYYSVHSFTQKWLYPYGYTRSFPKDIKDLGDVAITGCIAIKKTNGESYKPGPTATTIYPAAGGSIDWTYDTAKIKYSYALELRDKGRYGFRLPARFIKPTSTEIWAGIKAAAARAKSLGLDMN